MAKRKQAGENTPKLAQQQEQTGPTLPEADYLWEAVEANWQHILMMYKLFAQKKPIMLYDLQEKRIYAYPYVEFKAELSERSQQSLTEQYEDAVRDGKFVVFVRDPEQQRLRSFTVDCEQFRKL